jgi:hypothetical protein
VSEQDDESSAQRSQMDMWETVTSYAPVGSTFAWTDIGTAPASGVPIYHRVLRDDL